MSRSNIIALGIALLIGFGALPRAAFAQAPRPEDVASLDAIIAAYYDVVSGPAGVRPDYERDQSLHHPDAWVAIANRDAEGRPVTRVMTLREFYGDNGPRTAPFYEWETDRVVQRSGAMVHVWSHYATSSSPGGEIERRGVNSITLLDDGERWWVMGWMYDSAAR